MGWSYEDLLATPSPWIDEGFRLMDEERAQHEKDTAAYNQKLLTLKALKAAKKNSRRRRH